MYEGIFRKPRLKSNKILKLHAGIFKGRVINISGADDSDKNSSLKDYYFGNYDAGGKYKDYFTKASEYWISNFPDDKTKLNSKKENLIYLDLEKPLDPRLIGNFEVVFNHTVLEHVFDVRTAFRNLCLLSNDVVIIIVPQFQIIHDYLRGYKDYWRFTPFSIERLFEENNLKVLYRNTTSGFSSSKYLYYIGSKTPEKWKSYFDDLMPIEEYLNFRNNGMTNTLFSTFLMKIDSLIRKIFSILK